MSHPDPRRDDLNDTLLIDPPPEEADDDGLRGDAPAGLRRALDRMASTTNKDFDLDDVLRHLEAAMHWLEDEANPDVDLLANAARRARSRVQAAIISLDHVQRYGL
jgi:hypothetical protein